MPRKIVPALCTRAIAIGAWSRGKKALGNDIFDISSLPGGILPAPRNPNLEPRARCKTPTVSTGISKSSSCGPASSNPLPHRRFTCSVHVLQATLTGTKLLNETRCQCRNLQHCLPLLRASTNRSVSMCPDPAETYAASFFSIVLSHLTSQSPPSPTACHLCTCPNWRSPPRGSREPPACILTGLDFFFRHSGLHAGTEHVRNPRYLLARWLLRLWLL